MIRSYLTPTVATLRKRMRENKMKKHVATPEIFSRSFLHRVCSLVAKLIDMSSQYFTTHERSLGWGVGENDEKAFGRNYGSFSFWFWGLGNNTEKAMYHLCRYYLLISSFLRLRLSATDRPSLPRGGGNNGFFATWWCFEATAQSKSHLTLFDKVILVVDGDKVFIPIRILFTSECVVGQWLIDVILLSCFLSFLDRMCTWISPLMMQFER